MRAPLTIRDDDYRLSFLQGNFVTLTNMKDPEVEDAIDKMLSPMNVSLHAITITPECRRKLIGRNAPRGIEVLERFLEAGIEIHAQIVLCPGINDGDELLATLEYVEAHPGITSLAIVPLGFTKHQKRFTTCPGINDGDELLATLEYVEAHPGITSLAIVPLGFTKHQKRFTTSYSDDVEASRAVPSRHHEPCHRPAWLYQASEALHHLVLR